MTSAVMMLIKLYNPSKNELTLKSLLNQFSDTIINFDATMRAGYKGFGAKRFFIASFLLQSIG